MPRIITKSDKHLDTANFKFGSVSVTSKETVKRSAVAADVVKNEHHFKLQKLPSQRKRSLWNEKKQQIKNLGCRDIWRCHYKIQQQKGR
jgi:hypothetical protein